MAALSRNVSGCPLTRCPSAGKRGRPGCVESRFALPLPPSRHERPAPPLRMSTGIHGDSISYVRLQCAVTGVTLYSNGWACKCCRTHNSLRLVCGAQVVRRGDELSPKRSRIAVNARMAHGRGRHIPFVYGIIAPEVFSHARTAKVFMTNRSQAVRLPKEYQFSTAEVFIRKEGEDVILSPRPRDWRSVPGFRPSRVRCVHD